MSNAFLNGLKNTLDNEVSITENGAVGFKTTGTSLLDLNFAISSLRSASEDEIVKKFTKAFYEDPKTAVKWLFMARDVREGIGERRLFKVCFKWLAESKPEPVKSLISLVGEYGRFDDLLVLESTPLWEDAVKYIDDKLSEDMENCDTGKSISLLSKWLPSANTSSSETVRIARKLIAGLGISEKQYRKMLSKLRKYLDVTEVKTSSNDWDKIDYEKVASKANLKYKNAFLKHDGARRREFLGKLESGEAKINSGASTPVDVVHSYSSIRSVDETLEAMWKSLVEKHDGKLDNTLPILDGSGSMTCSIGNGRLSAMNVADGLGLYFSQIQNGFYKNKVMTFGGNPHFVDLTKCKNLHDKLGLLRTNNDCMNTNIALVFRVLLKNAVENNLTQEDMPKNLLIISDMEFDGECGGCYLDDDCKSVESGDYNFWSRQRSKCIKNYSAKELALFSKLQKEYEDAGFQMPRLVFWNVNSRTETIPVRENPLGCALISGFSQELLSMVMSQKTDPYEVLLEKINSKRYEPVERAICDLV